MRLVFIVLLSLGLAAATAPGSVDVRGAWIRTPPPGAKTAAAYAILVNREVSTDRLTGARSSVAADVDLHQSSMAGGVMRMRPVAGGLPIGASATVALQPGGYHLMLAGLRRTMSAGQKVRIVLHFQRAGDVAAEFTVRDTAP